MRKRIGIVLILASLWLVILPVQAQESLWTALLYDKTVGIMTQVNDAGVEVATITLPTVQSYTIFSDRAAVSPDGRYIAYTLTDPTTSNNAGILYDKTSNVVQTLYPSGSETVSYSSLWQAASSHLFSDTGFATGYSASAGGWRLVVSLFGGGVVSLESNSATVVTMGLSSQQGITPIVQYFTGTSVTFTLVSIDADSVQPLQSYVWDYVSGTVQPFGGTQMSDIDIFPATGEIVSAAFDTGFPNRARDFVLFQQANALHVYVPQTRMRFPFYAEGDLSLFQPRFVENGKRILVGLFDEFSGSGEWRLLERNGSLVDPTIILRAPDEFVIDPLGVDDGFIYITNVLSSDGTTTLMHVDTREGLNSGSIVWIGATAVPQRLVWVSETGIVSVDEEFMAWGQLANAQSEIISPLALPTSPAVTGVGLIVGGTALINTTEGDTLNMRSGAGRTFNIVTRLDDGTRVTIIEGPLTVDGLVWWHIRAGNVEGWVVESIEDDGAVIQTLIPG